ncbi:hypothetical protein PPROV_000879700 [Pycnococcus provasolii]|uniref:Rhodanese domain-containing protein n=1 Tax=Pycnococcus provasolii TaxID=41880 RepID=A0A830HSE1_9CHLO|nr:hypothetical protein PPROV_000879700 [Pycnococcus provasolii]
MATTTTSLTVRRAIPRAVSSTAAALTSPLVSPRWLKDNMSKSEVKILDSSWHMPLLKRSGPAEFLKRRIPTSQFFDIDAVCDKASNMPHMLPTPSDMCLALADLGVEEGDTVVCYDATGIFAAPRLWWMCSCLRINDTMPITPVVLDGGLNAWIASGGEVESGERLAAVEKGVRIAESAGVATYDASRISNFDDVRRAVDDGQANVQVVDARTAGRFGGTEPEPRPGLPSGHAPGSLNVPFSSLLVSAETPDGDKYTTMAPVEDLKARFDAAGVSKVGKPLVFSCGTGVTACTLALATELVAAESGMPAVPWSVYDGSWSEYASMPDAPIATTE